MNINASLKKLSGTKRYSGIIETIVYLIYRDWIAKPGSTAIDIGAHQGLHTFRMADCVGAKGRVLAFEPLPEMAANISKEAKNRYGENNCIEVRSAALSDCPGEETFYRSEYPSRSSLIVRNADFTGALEPYNVPIVTLDSLVDDGISKFVSIIKIDAEGAEFNILKGGKKFFAERWPLTVIEFSPQQLKDVNATTDEFFDYLDEINYSYYNLDGSPFDRDYVSRREPFPCYERFGAKRGHWIENFITERMPSLVNRQLDRYLQQSSS